MRIAVMGSGAVGGYYGARLALAGHDVTFIARGAHLDAIRAQGLQVRSPAPGDFTAWARAEQDTARRAGRPRPFRRQGVRQQHRDSGAHSAARSDGLSQEKRIEVEALHGALVRRAARAGVDVPIMATLYAVLKPWATPPA